MTKKEKLYRIKKTLKEVESPATIIFCSSDGPNIPRRQTVERQDIQ